MLVPFILGSLATVLFGVAQAAIVEIKGAKSFCFYDDLKVGANWGTQFQSSEGEFGIDVRALFFYHQ